MTSIRIVLLTSSVMAATAVSAQRSPAPPPPAHGGAEQRAAVLATGREIFVKRCASCHDERGDKPLASGLPLSRRQLSTAQVAKAVAGRLKGSPEGDRLAVTTYIMELMRH